VESSLVFISASVCHEVLQQEATTGDVLCFRFVDRHHSIVTQLLDGGLNEVHPGNFSVLVNKQAERHGCGL
jgi:hypothetical protein